MNNTDIKKEKITGITKNKDLDDIKRKIVTEKLETGFCAITFIVGLIGKVSFPLMFLLGALTAYKATRIVDLTNKKLGIESDIEQDIKTFEKEAMNNKAQEGYNKEEIINKIKEKYAKELNDDNKGAIKK